jgi:thiamine phosphate synthase YjbQ (UPF0047 family)
MKIILQKIEIQSRKGKELIDLTPQVERAVEKSGVKEGLVNVLTMHTSSGIISN